MTGDDGNGMNIQHEYLLVYARDKSILKSLKVKKKSFDNYSNPDNDPIIIWCAADPSLHGGDSTYFPIRNPYTGKKIFHLKGVIRLFKRYYGKIYKIRKNKI